MALAMSVPDPEGLSEAGAVAGTPTSELTQRELQVARRLAQGLTNKQIAADLVIAEGTADRHVSNILESSVSSPARKSLHGWSNTLPRPARRSEPSPRTYRGCAFCYMRACRPQVPPSPDRDGHAPLLSITSEDPPEAG